MRLRERVRPVLTRLLAAPRALPALRGLYPALWRRAAGRHSAGGSLPTAAFLRRRMLVLPALAVVSLALSAAAYADVHGRTQWLRDRCAPALVDLAQARTSLELAQGQADVRLLQTKKPGLVELGETYRSLLTEATQSLSRVARSGALHKGQEQELRVVSGLVVAYGDKIAWAERNRTSDVLRRAGVAYAEDMLRGRHRAVAPGTAQEPISILERLQELERQLHRKNHDLAAWSPLTLTGAAAAALAAVLFAFVLLGTSVFLVDRLRLISVQLAVAAVPVLLTPVLLACGGFGEHAAQERARAAVGGLDAVPAGATAPRRIESAAQEAKAAMREAHPEGWSLTAGIVVPAGGVGALACGVTLFLYGRPYPAVRTRRKLRNA
ncbi:hypothetical protein FBY35_6856 [Streptomyces sp. SLBN-118]|uniref:hypothetical protein n=1 Tax=Streptomyces sp. SLBN-118 TaxID=2768454 RepID=UPI00114F4935|nr:hypothetical protein [Streptomyces sp. SLBN-118]TQK45296.1 hypothetical protein FBY35_6856 [Streptomyces sp. SLBN-118]